MGSVISSSSNSIDLQFKCGNCFISFTEKYYDDHIDICNACTTLDHKGFVIVIAAKLGISIINSKSSFEQYFNIAQRYIDYRFKRVENVFQGLADFEPSYIEKYKKNKKETIVEIPKEDSVKSVPNEQNICCVCMNNPYNCLLMPCKHLCICSKCSESLDTCPKCRAKIEEKVIVYVG